MRIRTLLALTAGLTMLAGCTAESGPAAAPDGTVQPGASTRPTVARLSDDSMLGDGVAAYARYLERETGALVVRTQELVDAVKRGDIEAAKALFPVARTHWERIEPVADLVSDLRVWIDGREGVLPRGQEFAGFHRVERDLWQAGDVSGSGRVADRLLSDVSRFEELVNDREVFPLHVADTAKKLLDDAAVWKVTGEENRYSRTDLWGLAANLAGSEAAVQAFRPVLAERAPALLSTLDAEFADAWAVFDQHRRGAGWRRYDELPVAELRELSDAVNAVAEPVSHAGAYLVLG